LCEPPYSALELTMCEPAPASVQIARCSAAWPLAVAIAPTPPSRRRDALLEDRVGRVRDPAVDVPERSMLNSDAACSLFSNTNEVVRWIGTARAPVAGSGAAPACTASVSKPGSDEPGMGTPWTAGRARGGVARPHCGLYWFCIHLEERTMKVSDILRVKGGTLFTVAPEQQLADAVNVMSSHDIGSLVVMAHGELAGMLTFREVIQAVVKNGGALGDAKVASVMDDHPLTCTPDTEIDEVRRMMLGRHARYLPVMTERTLMGVISFYDVAKAVVDSQDFENRMLKAYIRDWPVEDRDEQPSSN
jgi:CBS domain-containing protein